MSETLGDALPREQARVRELVRQYRDPLLNGAGEIGAWLMEQSLAAADRAAVSGDLVAMLQAYEDLKGYTG